MKLNLFKTTTESLSRFHEPEVQIRLARIYWPILLSVGTITAVFGLLSGVWFFLSKDETLPETVIPVASGLKQEDLRALVEKLQERRSNFETLKK